MNDDWDADAMDNAALEQDVPLVQCLERGLAGEVEVQQVRGLLGQCAEVLCTVEPKSDTEGEELYALLHGIQGVIEPKAKGAHPCPDA